MDPLFALFVPQAGLEFRDIEARVLAAEDAGFHSVWFFDHLATPGAPGVDCLEAFTLATALAARTTTIRFGFLTLCDTLRPPALLAKMAATFDVISGGRLELGLGWGSSPAEYTTFGLGQRPPEARAARLGETLDVLRLLFSGEAVTYEGRHVHLRDARILPAPVQPRVPIHIGGTGRRLTLPLVAKHADWWNIPGDGEFAEFDQLRPLAGSARVSLLRLVGLLGPGASRDSVQALVSQRFPFWSDHVIGEPDEVAQDLCRLASRGVDMFVIPFTDQAAPRTIECFGATVIPQVRRMAGKA